MSRLEVSARMTIREGELEGFEKQAAEIIRQTAEKDTKTLGYKWFLNSDQTASRRIDWSHAYCDRWLRNDDLSHLGNQYGSAHLSQRSVAVRQTGSAETSRRRRAPESASRSTSLELMAASDSAGIDVVVCPAYGLHAVHRGAMGASFRTLFDEVALRLG